MKYLCLIFIGEKKYDVMPQSEQDACVKEHLAYDDELRKSGHLIVMGDKIVGAEGEFTLLRVKKPLRLKVSNFTCTEHPVLQKVYWGAEVTAEIRRSDFGMKMGIPASE